MRERNTDQGNVETMRNDFRDFKVFLLVRNLRPLSVHTNLLLWACRHYIRQAIYQKTLI